MQTEDIPLSVGQHFRSDRLNLLPEGIPSGYEVVSFEHVKERRDPVVLRNRWKQIIYQWPENYMPDFIDVIEVCKKLHLF